MLSNFHSKAISPTAILFGSIPIDFQIQTNPLILLKFVVISHFKYSFIISELFTILGDQMFTLNLTTISKN